MKSVGLPALVVALALLAGCGEKDPISESGPPSVTSRTTLEAQAQQYLDALVGTDPCDEVWKLVVSDGEEQSEFCAALADYRTEVRALTLGDMTDSTDDYTIFAVRVDYQDGSPPVLDSEVEIDVVDGKPLVAAGLP